MLTPKPITAPESMGCYNWPTLDQLKTPENKGEDIVIDRLTGNQVFWTIADSHST